MVMLVLPHGFQFERLNAVEMSLLDQNWENQCARFEENYDDYAKPSLDHARKIAGEDPNDHRYGIFGLRDQDKSFKLIMHVNHANLPGPTGKTLRVLWALLAPKYDFEAIADDELSSIIAGVMIGVVQLGNSSMSSRYIKFHLGSMPDRGILSGVARTLESVGVVADATIRGNWLHMTLANRPT